MNAKIINNTNIFKMNEEKKNLALGKAKSKNKAVETANESNLMLIAKIT